jgi:hypothetical protein
MRSAVWILLALTVTSAFAQDERHVTSPDGQIEFRLFLAPQEGRSLSRLAYEVSSKGKRVIETSFLGIDIWDQEPLLGENTGLISSSASSNPNYHSLVAKYMQNGSLGRLLEVEVRAYDDGVAFRYVIPRSILLKELLIGDEATEFALPKTGGMAITEVRAANFPPMHLSPSEGSVLLTRLARLPDNPKFAFQGNTPFTGPWRVVVIGPESKCVPQSGIVIDLNR